MPAKTIMFQGTGSSVGKSILAAAVCRILYQEGFKVAPFKSQNMTLNSYVAADGGEMSYTQAMQAAAAGIEPTVDMNPILLKPGGNMLSQLVFLGKQVGSANAWEYHERFAEKAKKLVIESLDRLRDNYEVIVIEGAGSPAEINLRENEIVNMRVAGWANAPVILISDIYRGGAFAWIAGTLDLLLPEERERVAGIVINKFCGDVKLLKPALDFIEKHTGKPVLGVIPYMKDLRIPEEDSQELFDESLALDEQFNRLADTVKANLDIQRLYEIIGL